jgi:biopolymer transport protein ExbD
MFNIRLVLLLTFFILSLLPALWRRPAAAPALDPRDTLTVWVLLDGAVYIEETPVPEKDLRRVLADVRSAYPRTAVMVRGDRRLTYAQVRRVLQLVNEAGFTRATLVPGSPTAAGQEFRAGG